MPKQVVRNSLAVRFAVLLTGILVVTGIVFSTWSNVEQQRASEQKVLEQARLLSQQMSSSWDYVDSVQSAINYNSDGRYDFKGVYCSVAGKSIALRFTQQTNCVIRYTRDDPRTGSDAPDSFELKALAAFKDGAQEYYDVVDYEGESSFRYLSAIHIVPGCLSCHGDPVGELDETGYPKEGMALNDLAGAVSLVIPMEAYQQEADARTASNASLFIVLAVIIVACTSIALHRWVTRPLSAFANAAEAVGSDQFADKIETVAGVCEIRDLVRQFSDIERRLRASYEHLEDQVRTRTSELHDANHALAERRDEIVRINDQLLSVNEALKQENEYKSAFLATMSHELRTPLASIIAFVNIWLRSAQGKDARDIEVMQSIERTSKSLLSTINNTLDAASIEAGRFPVHTAPVDLLDVVNAIRSLTAPLAGEKGVTFVVEADSTLPLVVTDQDILYKILANLVNNAVKFTDPGGEVRLGIEIDSGARQVVIEVHDTGIGIAEAERAVIFERFRQADSSVSRTYGGSGLGLALVQEMAELLGGSVSVSSIVGQGSTFTVSVPFEAVENNEGDGE